MIERVKHEFKRDPHPLHPRPPLRIRIHAPHHQIPQQAPRQLVPAPLQPLSRQQHPPKDLPLGIHLLEAGGAQVEGATAEEELGQDKAQREDVLLLGIL